GGRGEGAGWGASWRDVFPIGRGEGRVSCRLLLRTGGAATPRPAAAAPTGRRVPPYCPAPASPRRWLLLRLHPEAELIAVDVVDVEVPHAVRVILRLVQRSGASRFQLLIERVHISDEDIDGALARLPFRLARRLEVNDHAVPFDPSVERWLAVRELGVKAQHIAVVLDASDHVPYDKHRCGTAQ